MCVGVPCAAGPVEPERPASQSAAAGEPAHISYYRPLHHATIRGGMGQKQYNKQCFLVRFMENVEYF